MGIVARGVGHWIPREADRAVPAVVDQDFERGLEKEVDCISRGVNGCTVEAAIEFGVAVDELPAEEKEPLREFPEQGDDFAVSEFAAVVFGDLLVLGNRFSTGLDPVLTVEEFAVEDRLEERGVCSKKVVESLSVCLVVLCTLNEEERPHSKVRLAVIVGAIRLAPEAVEGDHAEDELEVRISGGVEGGGAIGPRKGAKDSKVNTG